MEEGLWAPCTPSVLNTCLIMNNRAILGWTVLTPEGVSSLFWKKEAAELSPGDQSQVPYRVPLCCEGL